jgi:hypothetical protein
MEPATAPKPEDQRAALRRALDRLEHVLPGQAPIRDFVHHNTLHGYQHLSFREAVAEAARRSGNRGFLPADEFRALLRSGRILERDLRAVVQECAALEPGAALGAGLDGLRRADVYLAALRVPLEPVAPPALRFAIEELEARSRFQPDVPAAERERIANGRPEGEAVSGLWRACLDTLELNYAPSHPETLRETARVAGGAEMRSQAELLLERLMGGVGRDTTLRGLMRALTGEDVLAYIRPLLLRHLAAHLDQGMAAWHNPGRGAGLYTAWRASAADDLVWSFIDLPEWGQITERLTDDALDTVIQELRLLGVPEQDWAAYLERLALELPGWAGMFAWRERRPGYAGSEGVPVDLADYLAVRLVLERVFVHGMCRRRWRIEPTLPALRWHFRQHPAELLVRHAVFNERLPEHLLALGRRLTQQATFAVEQVGDDHWEEAANRIAAWRAEAARHPEALTPHGSAWPLFRLCQHLGLSAERLRAAGPAGARALLACLARLDADTAGYLWLQAYERRYRDQVLGALAANHGRGAPPAKPEAQLVFCMDDREEGIRRHLEEANPALETFGAAGFFGVAVNWRGLDDTRVTPLCPVVVTPAHEAREQPRPGAEDALALHRHRRRLGALGKSLLHQQTRRGALAAAAVTAAAAPGALAALAAKVLAPAAAGRLAGRLRRRFEVPVPTAVAFIAAADSPPATPQQPRPGFTDAEQADRVQGLLRTIGLTCRFAPLVAILGHGSSSQNNPHLSAYDCGACSGRHGGPNARLFAAMANRAEVRALLAQRGLAIPEGTRFIGGERNTCDDTVAWFDTDLLPGAHRPLLAKLDAELAAAAQQHARERCRRFASAPASPSPERAARHVAARAYDFSQARPELGHVTNAAAFIGRRAMSRGAFFDRRAFLISYDCAQDPEGRVLEAILLAAGPVGAGISLEYYFSTVNNERYGCGSKVVHNVTGLLGVMEGANSDLRTGLPRQMIEIHEAMRLLVVAEHRTEILDAICARQPVLEELIGKGWVQLAAKDPEGPAIHVFKPGRGWLAWAPRDGAPPLVERSADWYDGHAEALPPALLRRPLVTPEAPGKKNINS